MTELLLPMRRLGTRFTSAIYPLGGPSRGKMGDLRGGDFHSRGVGKKLDFFKDSLLTIKKD